MLLHIKYGLERTPIDTGEFLVKCPLCETDQWADIMISSVYSHIFYIPVMPSDKDAFVCCKKCGLKRHGVPFNSGLISNYKEVKKMYRHPAYTYIGAVIIAVPILLAVIFLIIDSIK
jgi:hypothetical protein